MRAKNVLICLIGFLLLIPLLAATSYATVEVTCFPIHEYERSNGDPVTTTHTFYSAHDGSGTVKLTTNGEITDAVITLNGQVVWWEKQFKKKITYFEKTGPLVQGNNILEVFIEGKPGGKLWIEISHEVDADAAAYVDSEGGVVEVTDPDSPIYGASIEFLDDSIENNSLVTISIGSNNIQPDDNNTIVSEVVEITCSSELKGYALITCPLNTIINDGDSFTVLHYNDQTNEWDLFPISYINKGNNSATFATTHLSKYHIEQSKPFGNFPTQSHTNFKLTRDRFNATNNSITLEKYGICQVGQECDGICGGFAQFSLWYFLNYINDPVSDTDGLRCRWNEEKSVSVANLVSILANKLTEDLYDKIDSFLPGISLTYPSLRDYLIRQLDRGKPEVLLLGKRFKAWHNTVVYDYKIVSDQKIEYYCYEVGDSGIVPKTLVCEKNFGIWSFKYGDTNYDLFHQNYLGKILHSSFNKILSHQQFTPDDWCNEPPVLAYPNTVIDTIPVEGFPYGVAVTPDGSHVYVTNWVDNGSVSVIRTSDNTVIDTISVGNRPTDVAVTPDGSRVYVASSGNTVSVIRTSDNTVIDTISLSSTLGIAITPDGSRVYVNNYISDTVSVIRTSDNTVIDTISVGSYPVWIAVTPDGSHVYVTNYDDDTVSVIRTSDNTVIDTISLGNGLSPSGVAVTPDGSRVYVNNWDSGTVSVIRTSDNTVIDTISVSLGVSQIPGNYGIAVTPNGSYVYVSLGSDNTISVIQTSDNTVIDTISMEKRVWLLAVTPDGSSVYETDSDGAVSMIGF